MSSLQAAADRNPGGFGGLTQDERRHLQQWQIAARMLGIDAVEDFGDRPWPCPVGGVVLGIFQEGDSAATWMVIGSGGQWAVANCEEGSVSRSVDSFAEALALVCPQAAMFGRWD